MFLLLRQTEINVLWLCMFLLRIHKNVRENLRKSSSAHQRMKHCGSFFKIWVMVVAAEPKGTSCNFPSMSNILLSRTEVLQSLASCLQHSTKASHHHHNTRAGWELMRVRDKQDFYFFFYLRFFEKCWRCFSEKPWVCNYIFTLPGILY